MQSNAEAALASADIQHGNTGAPQRPPQILRLKEVMALVGLSRSAIYDMRGVAKFPKSVKIGARAVGWLADDIAAWIAQRADRNQVGFHPPARVRGPVSDPIDRVSVPPPKGKRRILSTLSDQENEELQRLRALELLVRRIHELHAEIVALLGPPGGGG